MLSDFPLQLSGFASGYGVPASIHYVVGDVLPQLADQGPAALPTPHVLAVVCEVVLPGPQL